MATSSAPSVIGVPRAAGPLDDGADEDDDTLCVVCMECPRERTLVPCGHSGLCLRCTEEVLERAAAKGEAATCPMCRVKVSVGVGKWVGPRHVLCAGTWC